VKIPKGTSCWYNGQKKIPKAYSYSGGSGEWEKVASTCWCVFGSVPDPDPPGSEIIWPQGSGFSFFTPNLKICFNNVPTKKGTNSS